MHNLNLKHAVTDRVGSGEGLCHSPAYTYIAELTVVILSDITAVRRTDPSTILFRQLLDALIRRKLPVGLDALDADAPDAFYQRSGKT